MAHYSEECKKELATAAEEPVDDGSSPLGELLNILWRRKRLIVAVVILLTTPAVLIGLRTVPEYTASAMVMIDPRKNSVVDVKEVSPGLENRLGTLESQVLETQVFVARSRNLIVQTMEALDLFNDPELGAAAPEGGAPGTVSQGLLSTAGDWLAAQLRTAKQLVLAALGPGKEVAGGVEAMSLQEVTLSAEELTREAVATFADNLAVARSPDTSVLSISYTSRDPVKAARIANHLAGLYVDSQLQEKSGVTGRANVWLSERLQALQDEVIEAERAVARFQAENELLGAGGKGLNEAQLADLNRVLVETRVERAEKEASLRLIGELKASGKDLGSIAQVVASPFISDLRERLAQLISREAELATTLGQRHPQMQALREERAKLAAEINNEVNRIIGSLENELTVIATREWNLEQELQRAKSENALQSQSAVRMRELEREADARRVLYETLLTRYQQTKTQEGLLEPDARVIYPADVPLDPSTLPPAAFAAVGLTASMVFGCLLAVILEQLDKSLRSGLQVERLLRVPCLGIVPRVSTLGREQTLNGYLRDKPRSSYAEGIRALHAATLATEIDPPPRVVLVTSALPGEGKTSVASCLAAAAAQSGRKVVLVDFDLRRPGVARAFGLRPDSGVVGVIAEGRPLDGALVTGEFAGVDILPVEWTPENPAALITSPRIASLFGELRDRYDTVVVDAPPIIGVADARILSRYVDATIFVVRWERTKRDAAAAGLRVLSDASATIAGVVLTQVDLKKHARYRYGDGAQYLGAYRKYYSD